MSYCWVRVGGASRVRVDQGGTPGCGLTCWLGLPNWLPEQGAG